LSPTLFLTIITDPIELKILQNLRTGFITEDKGLLEAPFNILKREGGNPMLGQRVNVKFNCL
jgi:hypothetical protein